MRRSMSFGLVFFFALSFGACGASEDDAVSPEESGIVQFPTGAFANAPLLTYGATTQPIAYTRATGWRAVRWNGTAGDEFVATVTPTTADRVARAYLVEKQGSQYVSILSGTQSVDGVVKAKLDKTQEYFIAFRDYSRRNASFTVHLAKAAGLPAGCTGTPLLEQGIIDRTAQAAEPGITLTGSYESTVRRCNVATGCDDPIVTKLPLATSLLKQSSGRWALTNFGYELDGTTGDFGGQLFVQDVPNPIAVTGAATTGCVSFAGSGRVAIDAITYSDVSVVFSAPTPPVAARTPYPLTPPAAECEGQSVIPDEEVLARFPRGASKVALGSGGSIVEDSQLCHPQTGCTAWRRVTTDPHFTSRSVSASSYVVAANTLGIALDAAYTYACNPAVYWDRKCPTAAVGPASAELSNGTFTLKGPNDVLRFGVQTTAAQAGSVSDTHIFVRDVNLTTAGTTKSRRYTCIPITAHP